MKTKILFALLLLGGTAIAQEKMLTPESAVFAAREGLLPDRLVQLGWVKGTETFYYIDRSSGMETLVTGKATEKGKTKPVITLFQLNELLTKNNSFGNNPMKAFPAITWKDATTFTFKTAKVVCTYNAASGKLDMVANDVPADIANPEEAPGGGYLAYTRDNNLFIGTSSEGKDRKMGGWKEIAVTSDSEKNIVNGQSVHRDEFGIHKGTFWSPTGHSLAFYRMDQTMVTDYPIIDLTKQPAEAKVIKYPMAGGKSHEVTVGVYNVASGKTIFLETGEPKEQYLTNIAWSPDEKFIYITVVNRDQNHLWLNRYSAETGKFDKTLFEETDEKYVHPMHTLIFVPGKPNLFVWQSERNDANALYLYDTDGKLIRQLTPTPGNKSRPALVVTNVYGIDPQGKNVYFQAASYDRINRAIYRASLDKGAVSQLAVSPGVHTASFSTSMNFFLDDYSSPQTPRIQSISSNAGKNLVTLLTAKDPLTGYKKCEVRLFTITAADGQTPLWCRMILPAGFDSTKKYRSLTYVYNGPNVQLITETWLGGPDLFLYYMAQQGFVVFTVDGRGSGNRGIKFEQATFRHLGTQEIADQEKGADYLKSLPYVDSQRMAVYGWSYGGFMTTSLMTRKAGLYKCGVAGGPVIDWSYYEVMYTERYMDTPQTNPDGYKESSLFSYCGDLKGKLLLIHGTADDVVVWQHSLNYIKNCVDKGTQTDYYVYPGHPHNVRGKDRVHLLTKVSEYIIANT